MPFMLPENPLARRRSLPAGGEACALEMADGWRVRACHWPAREPSDRGSLLLLTGRGDFMEKYAESLHDFLDAGWAVAVFDWRGQGGSGRLGASPLHGDIEDFKIWLQDLETVMDWFHRTYPGPHHAVAHSMGGHLLLRHLTLHPDALRRAVLVAPMLGLKIAGLGLRAMGAVAGLMTALGQGRALVTGAPNEARQSLLTSDPERYEDERWWKAEQPELALGSPTWGWLAAAVRSMQELRPERLRTPLLVLMAENEALVDNHATTRLLAGHAELETIKGAAHEILREASDIRALVLARIEAYLTA